ncbi:hypothetical protein SAMN05444851_2285 [Aliiroseovarius sediminilitoris]|uniref:Uncharacterized protein n=1 Tax=Aliiroseovarius sediminilitoris TaxID=1173584 RepID=A0A1I0Q6V2_9RHOB|nr:hypothetical protein [Aliiroseovarius sediminilitoris]SEW22645.1 hypothetical protein SAMN05444851_2285 [Aliiroseovarius sediminilitoris]
MSISLPDYYFRVRENGAFVFRVNTENRQRPLELDQIAAVNIKNGEVKPQGGYQLTKADHAAIAEWMADRRAALEARELDDILRSVDHLNLTAHWAQTRATPEALEQVTDALLLAMHDLRSVLVRKKADRLKQD